jgi:hypothetical protein
MLGSFKSNIESLWKDDERSFNDFDNLPSFNNFMESQHSPLKILYSPQKVLTGPFSEATDC